MLTLAVAKGFWGCFSCVLLHLHQSPPTFSAGRRVACVATACWAEEGEAQERHCDASWGENLSQMSQRFLEKTLQCGTFFWEAYLLLLNSVSSSVIPYRAWSCCRKPSATSKIYPPLTACTLWCMNHSLCTLSFLRGDQWMFRLPWKRGPGQSSFGQLQNSLTPCSMEMWANKRESK